MSLYGLFIHRATLHNPGQAAGEDDYGRPMYSDPTSETISCRVDAKTRRSSDDEGVDYITEHTLMTWPHVEMTLSSTVTDIRDKRGNVVLEGEFYVEDLFPAYNRSRLHHIEAKLKRK